MNQANNIYFHGVVIIKQRLTLGKMAQLMQLMWTVDVKMKALLNYSVHSPISVHDDICEEENMDDPKRATIQVFYLSNHREPFLNYFYLLICHNS